MTFVLYLFVILHILTAAAWFGMGLRLAARARAVATTDPVAAGPLADDTARTVRLMGIFIVLTLIFSYAAFFIGGGFAAYGRLPEFHIAFTLILVLVAVHFLLIHRPWGRLDAIVRGSESGDAPGLAKKVAMGTGIGHLLWLVLLVLMFWRHLSAGLGA
jgi:hypothetical protein